MKREEMAVIAVFVFGHVTGAVMADTVPQAAVGSVLTVAVAVVLIKIVERAGLVTAS